VAEGYPVTNESVRIMTFRVYPAFIASISAIAVMFAATETFARPGATTRGAFASAHSISHRAIPRTLRHHRLNNTGAFWPGVGDDKGFYGPSNGGLTAEGSQPSSSDVHYTYDVPWDWAHRYPPAVAPSERAYVPSCPTAAVEVPGRGGKRQTVNVTQCF
jgi:hypothetical protein